MPTKLTLSIDKKAIEIAKQYSRKKGLSLSRLVEDYFRSFNKRAASGKKKSRVENLVGLIGTAPKDFNYKNELMDVLEKKYKA